jgi:hypothetical protein
MSLPKRNKQTVATHKEQQKHHSKYQTFRVMLSKQMQLRIGIYVEDAGHKNTYLTNTQNIQE